MLETTLSRTQGITSQVEKEKREVREVEEFINILKGLSETERAEAKGYISCLRDINLIKTA